MIGDIRHQTDLELLRSYWSQSMIASTFLLRGPFSRFGYMRSQSRSFFGRHRGRFGGASATALFVAAAAETRSGGANASST
jgi:hypothetical protein